MNKEQVEELKQIRKELEIPKKDFLELSGLSLNYKEFENPSITDEDVFELIKESMMCFDNKPLTEDHPRVKSVEQSFLMAKDKMGFEGVYMGTHEDMDRDFPSLI